MAECEQLYDLKIVYGDVVKMKHIKKLRKKLYALKQAENIVFVHGIGKRKTPLQKSIETLEDYLSRLKKYNQEIYICGERNSYSKTDHDATFMQDEGRCHGKRTVKTSIQSSAWCGLRIHHMAYGRPTAHRYHNPDSFLKMCRRTSEIQV